ncbi:MAG TPA: glycosyltransferase, partial [Thermoanaerobaculia bacterium]|nr:glycosyltransferase [Thermoanaerobaculia bacterium]
HPHPGYHRSYDHAEDPRVGRSYALKIQGHRAGFTDCLIYRYVVAKHFEIPATGALLLADRAVKGELAKLGFLDNVHYVSVSHNDLEDRLRYVLDPANHEELDQIRHRGQALIWQRHTTADRAALIDRVCTP